MTMLDYGLIAAAALMLLFALRALTNKESRDSLGCGFGLITALLWMWVLRRQLDEFPLIDAGRVGVGILLVLPAAKALAQPKGARIVMAGISLILAFVIAGPVVSRLWSEHKPDIVRTRIEVLSDQIQELDTVLSERRGYLDQVALKHSELRGSVSESKVDSADIASHPEIERKLAAILRLEPILEQLRSEVDGLEMRLEESNAALEDARRSPIEAEPEPEDLLRIYLDGLEELPALEVDLTDEERLQKRAEHQLLLDTLTRN
jgi:hypothetical protein